MGATHDTESVLLHKGPCDKCGSSDGRAVYDDGHSYCFAGCSDDDRYEGPTGEGTGRPAPERKPHKDLLPVGEYRDLNKRALTAETCRRFGYSVGRDRDGEPVQIATYCDATGAPVAQKLRTPDKDFAVLGDLKKAGLFGQHLWPAKGNKIVITEGEIDCLSVAQAQALKWPTVSIPNGAQGAAKAITKSLEFLRGYNEIILWFDNDEPGRKAVEECALLLPPGKCKVIVTPDDLKDANDLLRERGPAAVVKCIFDAQTYRPDGVIGGEQLTVERLKAKAAPGWQTPYPKLNEMTRGIRPRQLWMITAGTGVGKSTDAREWMYAALCEGMPCGAVFLEESVEDTAKYLVALDHNVLAEDLEDNPEILTDAQWAASHAKLFAPPGLYQAYDHFGAMDSDSLIAKLEFMAANGARLLFLDHITIAATGLDLEGVDALMVNLRSLIERTGCSIVCISHLRKTPTGAKAAEEGGQISLDDLKGSGSIKQIPDVIIAKERNQQAENEAERDVAQLRVLKVRRGGKTGPADKVKYDTVTGRLTPFVEPDPMECPEDDDDVPF
ncbi:DnaB-like helicase C-terminal domain-containing protein [Cupriavidus nantongensis]|uniref:DnaB-like helicase C-terminal domain-containing protein n=1 Tax=Cupriavidus nantongensis TaxID=1796606 RepID=UPI0009EEC794